MCINVLRIEIKIIKTEELKKTGISTFADVNLETINNAKKLLLKRLDEVMHYDSSLNQTNLSNSQKRMLKSYSNPRYWIDELKPRYRDRHKKKLKEITRKYSENKAIQIRQNIIEKCVIINTSNIELNKTHLKSRKCLVTGVDISMQKESSFLLSHTGLNNLYKTNRILYNKIKKRHLSKHWLNEDLQTEIREIAHNIRDKIRSRRKKQKRLYPKQQLHLFGITA
jgi:hypothetical protein